MDRQLLKRVASVAGASDLAPLLLATIALTVLPILFIPVSLLDLDRSLKQMEEQFVRRETSTAMDALQGAGEYLDGTAQDWAYWDDTHTFFLAPSTEYIDNNLDTESLASVNVNLMIFVDLQGKVVQTAENGWMGPQAQGIVDSHPQLLAIQDPLEGVSGIVLLENRPYHAASRRVLTSNREGPPAGTLILLSAIAANPQDQKQTGLSIFSLDADGLPQDVSGAAAKLSTPEDSAVVALSDDLIAGYRLVNDLDGNPRLLARIGLPRDIYHLGLENRRRFIGTLLLASIFIFYLVYYSVRRYQAGLKQRSETMQRYQAVIQQSNDAYLLLGEGRRILDANPACQNLLGFLLEPGKKVTLDGVLRLAGSSAEQAACLKALGRPHSPTEISVRMSDGDTLQLESFASVVYYGGKEALCIILRDIRERKEMETALRLSEERYTLATRGAKDGLWDWDVINEKIYFSTRWKEMLGYAEEDIGSTPDDWYSLVHPDDLIRLRSEISIHLKGNSSNFECEHRMRHKNGSYLWMLSRGMGVWNNEGYAYRMVGSQTDVTSRKQIEDQLRHDALHDPLTHLPNRTLLMERMKVAHERARRRIGTSYAVLYLDLDRFKSVNDTLGHTVGDQILVQLSERVQRHIRSLDTLARLGGDEFVLLLEDVQDRQKVLRVAQRIQDELKRPFPAAEREVVLSVSIGVVFPTPAYANVEEVLRDADIAMYSAKESGRQRTVVFDRSMYDHAIERMTLEHEMRQALERQEFMVYYQPIYDAATNRITGFEALLRWMHPARGVILPGVFIPVAEETGMIVPLGRWVLRTACSQVKLWHEQFPQDPPLTISVNLSARQFAQSNLLEDIHSILEETGFPPACLWIEITESILIQDLDAAVETLQQMRKMGMRVEIDDFGTGYSSLSYLQNLPVDGIKIDRSFIGGMEKDESNRQIVRTIIDLARNLGFHHTAEGVETEGEMNALMNMDCKYVQGFLFSHPVDARNIETILEGIHPS